MMLAHALISFLIAAIVLTVTPGLDSTLVLRTAAIEGPARAARTGFGIIVGCLAWGAAVTIGLGALLAASQIAFSVLKWAGVAYLVWLGAQFILHPRHKLPAVESESDGGLARPRTNWFWKGMLQNLLNPKIGVFYVSFLPQFVPAGVAAGPFTFLLAAIHGGITAIWFAVLIGATQPLVQVLRRPSVLKAMDRLTGGVFLLFGAKLALSHR